MTRVKRFAYFFGGFSVGVFLLMFFLGGKNASCAYGPNARVLKNIRIKHPEISATALQGMSNHGLDTSVVSQFLRNGKVLFRDSNIKINDSCKQYVIRGRARDDQRYLMQVKNCDSTALITDFTKYVDN